MNDKKYTLVLGASEKRERYSNKAIRMLLQNGHPLAAIGIKKGMVETISIVTEKVSWKKIDTITLYLGISHQKEYYDYILSLKPKRIIFNPGTENDELQNLAIQNGIECLEACTLVLLSIGKY